MSDPFNDRSRRWFLGAGGALIGTAALARASGAARVHAGDRDAAALTALSAGDAVAAMISGQLSAETYANVLLDRARRLERLNVFCTFHPEQVRAAALGPIFAQGAILMGKTNLHELSLGWTSNNATFGPVRNPYDLARTPGGSSGGSAAAVAAGIAPLAIGEDTWGSIRVPASFCGVAGLRPTHGRYPDAGVMPLTHDKFDQVGPLARSVADIILFDSVVTGQRERLSPPPLRGVRLGISPRYLEAQIDPECGRIVAKTVGRLSKAGARIVTAELPPLLREAPAVVTSILTYELLDSIAGFLQAEDAGITLDEVIARAGPSVRPLLEGRRHSGPPEAYRAALKKRKQIVAAAADYFREHRIDALAFPPTIVPAFLQGDPASVSIAGRQVDLFTAIGRNIALGSCAGLACLVLPAGMTADGLPVGLEFDAPAGGDRRLLALGLSLERALGPIPAPRLSA